MVDETNCGMAHRESSPKDPTVIRACSVNTGTDWSGGASDIDRFVLAVPKCEISRPGEVWAAEVSRSGIYVGLDERERVKSMRDCVVFR